MDRARIAIFDTTLRDGEQSPGCSMNVQEKLRLAEQLDRLGADIIEAGFPIASEGDFAAVQAIAAKVRRPIIAALARAATQDIERAWQALQGAARPRIHVFLATSDIHLESKLRISRAQCLKQAGEMVRLAKNYCADIEFSPEDATRTDRAFLYQVIEAVIAAGATTINIPDTVGYTIPSEFAELIAGIRKHVPNIGGAVISAHCHNDLGLAVANSLAAIVAGARQVECAINGIGERAGNAALEEIVMAMRVRPDLYACETGIVSEQLHATSHMLAEITGVPVQPNKAITGRNAFAHEAGIHQDGVLKNPLTYEIMTPQSVGAPDSRLVLGKHSGRHALGIRCEQLGHQFDRRQLDEIYRRFVILADKIKHVEDYHLLDLIRQARDSNLKMPARAESQKPMAAVAAAGTNGEAFRSSSTAGKPRQYFGMQRGASDVPLTPVSDRPWESEDHLWGV